MILHKSPNAQVEWFEKEKVVLKRFKGFIHGDELHSAFNAGYEQLKNPIKTNGYLIIVDYPFINKKILNGLTTIGF
jgi:hypothetical protein